MSSKSSVCPSTCPASWLCAFVTVHSSPSLKLVLCLKVQLRFPPGSSAALCGCYSSRAPPYWHTGPLALTPHRWQEKLLRLAPTPLTVQLAWIFLIHLYSLHLTKCLTHRKHRRNGDRTQLNLVKQAGPSLFTQIKNRFLQVYVYVYKFKSNESQIYHPHFGFV